MQSKLLDRIYFLCSPVKGDQPVKLSYLTINDFKQVALQMNPMIQSDPWIEGLEAEEAKLGLYDALIVVHHVDGDYDAYIVPFKDLAAKLDELWIDLLVSTTVKTPTLE